MITDGITGNRSEEHSTIRVPSYHSASTLSEAFAVAQNHAGSFSYVAGGTDLMVRRKQGLEDSCCLIDLTRIGELQGVYIKERNIEIGGLTTLHELSEYKNNGERLPLLREAALSVGGPAIRYSATLGGNLLCENRCTHYNQSEFWRTAVGFCLKCAGHTCHVSGGKTVCYARYVSDTAPALLCLNARTVVGYPDGEKTIPLRELFSGDGVHPLNLGKYGIIKRIQIPLPFPEKTWFRKLRPRKAMDFTSLTIAMARREGRITIAMSGVAMAPVFTENNEINISVEPLIKEVWKQCKIVDNDYFSKEYRKEMAGVFLRQGMEAVG